MSLILLGSSLWFLSLSGDVDDALDDGDRCQQGDEPEAIRIHLAPETGRFALLALTEPPSRLHIRSP